MPDTPPAIDQSSRRRLLLGLGVFVVACGVLGFRLGYETPFVDESAYVAQSFYADLFLEGRHDDPAWLDYAAVDLPPLTKYLVGFALRAGGYARPGRSAPGDWYRNTSTRFVGDSALNVARIPSVLFGALGCVGLYAIGTRAFGRPAGLVAAGLLMFNPLYRLLARRAMSDVPAEACMIIALAFGLAGWSRWVEGKGGWRAWIESGVLAGLFTGLAVLSKLNGTIAGMVLACWMILGLILMKMPTPGRVGNAGRDPEFDRVLLDKRMPRRAGLGLVAATILAGAVSFGTFVALNPFLTAKPPGTLRSPLKTLAELSFVDRLKLVKDHRVGVSENGMQLFPADALPTPFDKFKAVVVQGYGRFSPLGPAHSDSTNRFDWRQDWGALIWWPIVLAGLIVAIIRGVNQHRAGMPPTAWAIALAAILAFVVVTSFIPLAWDRYYLSLQPGAALLASAALTAPFARFRRRPEPA
jgi:Dolichyl-phosphate-mannose-protein mannosyltransferase